MKFSILKDENLQGKKEIFPIFSVMKFIERNIKYCKPIN